MRENLHQQHQQNAVKNDSSAQQQLSKTKNAREEWYKHNIDITNCTKDDSDIFVEYYNGKLYDGERVKTGAIKNNDSVKLNSVQVYSKADGPQDTTYLRVKGNGPGQRFGENRRVEMHNDWRYKITTDDGSYEFKGCKGDGCKC